MRCRRIFLIVAAFAVSICVGKASAQILPSEATDSGLGGSNIITGSVLASTGQRLQRRIAIRLQTATKGDRIATTDDYGNFAFRGLPSGDYMIVIDKEKDFEPFTQAVTVIQVRGFPPQTYNLSIRLTPKDNPQPKPNVVNAAVEGLGERGKSLFAKAKEFEAVGDHKAAVDQLLLLTNEFPKFMLGFNELGVEYLKANELEKADTAFRTAIELSPDAFAPKLNRGIVLVSLKKYNDAEPILRAAREMDERSGPVRYFYGTALANLGKFDEAEKELSAAVSMGGNEMAEAHRILAIIYSSKGDKKRAAAEIEAYLKINPSAPDAEQLKRVLAQLQGR